MREFVIPSSEHVMDERMDDYSYFSAFPIENKSNIVLITSSTPRSLKPLYNIVVCVNGSDFNGIEDQIGRFE